MLGGLEVIDLLPTIYGVAWSYTEYYDEHASDSFEIECFISKQSAEEFAKGLRAKFVTHISGIIEIQVKP